MNTDYNLDHLDELEAESIYVIREVAAQFERPAILFSGGKDSIVVTHLAAKAFAPARIPMRRTQPCSEPTWTAVTRPSTSSSPVTSPSMISSPSIVARTRCMTAG